MVERGNNITGAKGMLKRARDGARLAHESEERKNQEQGSPWETYGSSKGEYSTSFREVLHEPNLDSLISEMKRDKENILALDFMGEGQVLRDLDIDGGQAVTLGDFRSDEKRQYDADHNIDFVASQDGVLSGKTWRRMRQGLETQTVSERKKFDLIMARPYGGLDNIPTDPNAYYKIGNELYKLLDENNGVMLMSLDYSESGPDFYLAREFLKKWEELMHEIPDISFVMHCDDMSTAIAIKITKKPGAPENLPQLDLSS